MDNRLFNVNGKGLQLLQQVLELAFKQEDWSNGRTCRSWQFDKEKGLILNWTEVEGANILPTPLDASGVAPIVWRWLNDKKREKHSLGDWEGDIDHDGSNGEGWRVYVEDWGHVGEHRYAICAIKFCYMWYGK